MSDDLLERLDIVGRMGNRFAELAAARIRELEAKLESERKARERAERKLEAEYIHCEQSQQRAVAAEATNSLQAQNIAILCKELEANEKDTAEVYAKLEAAEAKLAAAPEK